MNPEEFWMARRLIAEEGVGKLIRQRQRTIQRQDEEDQNVHETSMALLRAVQERQN